MPSRKRTALSEIDANIAPKKRIATGRKPRTDIRVTFHETAFEGPYEYIYLKETVGADSDDGNESTADDEDDEQKHIKHGYPANDHTYKYIMMQEAWELLERHRRLASYCDPDNFDMYITNYHFGYGVIQCIESLVRSLFPSERHM